MNAYLSAETLTRTQQAREQPDVPDFRGAWAYAAGAMDLLSQARAKAYFKLWIRVRGLKGIKTWTRCATAVGRRDGPSSRADRPRLERSG